MQGSQRVRTAIAASLAAGLLATTGAAVAQADAPPVLKSPGKGRVLAVGSQPTFKIVDHGTPYAHHVWISIAKTRKLDKHGRLAGWEATGMVFDQMKRGKHDTWTWKATKFSFPQWFMNAPGTYYWQAEAISSATRSGYEHSKIGRIVVR